MSAPGLKNCDNVLDVCMGWAHSTTARRVRNDYNRPKDDEAEAIVSAPARRDLDLYQPAATSDSDKMTSYRHKPGYIFDFIEYGD